MKIFERKKDHTCDILWVLAVVFSTNETKFAVKVGITIAFALSAPVTVPVATRIATQARILEWSR